MPLSGGGPSPRHSGASGTPVGKLSSLFALEVKLVLSSDLQSSAGDIGRSIRLRLVLIS